MSPPIHWHGQTRGSTDSSGYSNQRSCQGKRERRGRRERKKHKVGRQIESGRKRDCATREDHSHARGPMLDGDFGKRSHSPTKNSGIQRPPSTTRRRDQEERPCGSGYGPKSGTPFAGTHSTPIGQSAQPSAYICVQRNQCSNAGGNRRQRRSERNAQASDSTARRVLRQIESKARQTKRRKTVGMVADARGSCPYGIESRTTSSCAVVKRKSSRTSKRYTNCATAFTGRKHREEHPERTAEARRRLGRWTAAVKTTTAAKAWKKITREVIP